MSAVTLAPEFEDADADADADANIATIVRFQNYADETREHLERIARMLAGGDQALLKDLLLVVRFLWG